MLWRTVRWRRRSLLLTGDSRLVPRALDAGLELVEPVHGAMSITTSTSGPTAGGHALRAIRETDGGAYGIEREDVEAALRTLGREGIFVELASALSIAGVEYAVANGAVEAGEQIVCLATGTGVKWPEQTRTAVGTAPTIDPTIDALEEAFEIDLNAPAT